MFDEDTHIGRVVSRAIKINSVAHIWDPARTHKHNRLVAVAVAIVIVVIVAVAVAVVFAVHFLLLSVSFFSNCVHTTMVLTLTSGSGLIIFRANAPFTRISLTRFSPCTPQTFTALRYIDTACVWMSRGLVAQFHSSNDATRNAPARAGSLHATQVFELLFNILLSFSVCYCCVSFHGAFFVAFARSLSTFSVNISRSLMWAVPGRAFESANVLFGSRTRIILL